VRDVVPGAVMLEGVLRAIRSSAWAVAIWSIGGTGMHMETERRKGLLFSEEKRNKKDFIFWVRDG
jgi:hypothetical protein